MSERLRHGWELALIAGPHEGARGLTWMKPKPPPVILVGRCRDPEGCTVLAPGRVDHGGEGHVWYWLPSEKRPHDAVVYRLVHQAWGPYRSKNDGHHYDGLARYAVGDTQVPIRGDRVEAHVQ